MITIDSGNINDEIIYQLFDVEGNEAEAPNDIAKGVSDRRERAKIARAAGYSAKAIEGVLSKRRNENETESE